MWLKHVTHNVLGLDCAGAERFGLPGIHRAPVFEKPGFLRLFLVLIGRSIDVCVFGRKEVLCVSEAAIHSCLLS